MANYDDKVLSPRLNRLNPRGKHLTMLEVRQLRRAAALSTWFSKYGERNPKALASELEQSLSEISRIIVQALGDDK